MRQTPTLMLSFFLLKTKGVNHLAYIYRSNSSINFSLSSSLIFMVESIYHRCCKSIIGYQYLSLTFLTCLTICFYFLSCVYTSIERWHTTHLTSKKVKDEASFSFLVLFKVLSGIKSLIRRWNKEICRVVFFSCAC